MFSAINKSAPHLARAFVILSALLMTCCVQGKQPLQATANITYNSQSQHLDLYTPSSISKHSALMFIHGGGFNAGGKEDMAAHAKHYAALGFVTASINYRSSLDERYPAAINDATDALNWMKSKASEYGYSANKIILIGYSAGGTIALNVGLDAANNTAAVIDIAGITDLEAFVSAGTVPGLKENMNKYMGGKDPVLASPLYQVNQYAPPIFIFHGKNDGLVPISQSTALMEQLKQHNVPVSFYALPNADHEIMLPSNRHFKKLMDEITNVIMAIENSSN